MEHPIEPETAAEPQPLTESNASLLVGLIDGLTAAARQGESLDVEALAGEHPRRRPTIPLAVGNDLGHRVAGAAPRSRDGSQGISQSRFPRQTPRLIGPQPPRAPFSSAIISSSKS